MKKKDLVKTMEALKKVSVHDMSKDDRNAILDNLIVIGIELDNLAKVERVAVETLKPAGFDELNGEEKELAAQRYNISFNDYMVPKYQEEVAAEFASITDEAFDCIVAQQGVNVEGLALIRKFFVKA